MKNMSLNVEERLIIKLFAFTGFNAKDEQETADESDFETQRILAEATSAQAKRYYFGSLKLIFCQVCLNMCNRSLHLTIYLYSYHLRFEKPTDIFRF